MNQVLPILAGIAVAIAVALTYRANQKRSRKFAAWAAAHGWSYTPRDNSYADLDFGRPFGQGHSRRALDVMTSVVDGRATFCFTLRYETTSGGGETTSEQTHYYAVFAVQLPKSLPTLRVERERLLGRLARAVGLHDIEFESEDFNRAYAVHCENRKFASDVINPQMMQFLLVNNAPGFRIVNGYLVCLGQDKLKLETIEPTVRYMTAILKYVPGFVWAG